MAGAMFLEEPVFRISMFLSFYDLVVTVPLTKLRFNNDQIALTTFYVFVFWQIILSSVAYIHYLQ